MFECNASEPYIPIDVATATDNDSPGNSSETQSRTTSTPAPNSEEPEQEISASGAGDEPEDEMETPAEGAEEAHENMTASPRREPSRPEALIGEPSDEAGECDTSFICDSFTHNVCVRLAFVLTLLWIHSISNVIFTVSVDVKMQKQVLSMNRPLPRSIYFMVHVS